MPLASSDSFLVGKTKARLINASASFPAKIFNSGAGKLYYKNASDVSTSSTEIAVGASVTAEEVVWIIADTRATCLLEHPEAQTVQSEVIGGTLKVTGATTLAGATSVAGASAIPGVYAGGWNPVAATSGTDTTPAEKKLFVTSIYLPANKKIKGIGYLVGSVGGTNKAVAGLFSATGEILAHSTETTEGTTVGTAAEIQELNLTAEYSATGPALYFIGITMNGNTARLRTIPKNTAGSNVLSEEITIAAKNVLAKITAPTAFAADKGPVCWIY